MCSPISSAVSTIIAAPPPRPVPASPLILKQLSDQLELGALHNSRILIKVTQVLLI